MTRNLYGEVTKLGDIREINRRIRHEMAEAETPDQMTELKRRSDHLCTLTYAPSWQQRFGRKTVRFRTAAREGERAAGRDQRDPETFRKGGRRSDRHGPSRAQRRGDESLHRVSRN